MTGDDENSLTRAQLERIAFGRADTPAEISAAQDALAKLVTQDAALARAAHAETAHVQTARSAPAAAGQAQERFGAGAILQAQTRSPGENESGDLDAPVRDAALRDESRPSTRSGSQRVRRRSLLPLLVLTGLFAGAVGGVLLARAQATNVEPLPAAAAGSTPTPAPRADAGAALASMLVPQSSADKQFPLSGTLTTFDIQPASVHRILTTSDGATLWTGRTDTDICLIWTASGRADGSTGGIGCATPLAFANGGVSVSEGLVTWSWNGTAFTTTLAH